MHASCAKPLSNDSFAICGLTDHDYRNRSRPYRLPDDGTIPSARVRTSHDSCFHSRAITFCQHRLNAYKNTSKPGIVSFL